MYYCLHLATAGITYGFCGFTTGTGDGVMVGPGQLPLLVFICTMHGDLDGDCQFFVLCVLASQTGCTGLYPSHDPFAAAPGG